jgi:hypothetical protein
MCNASTGGLHNGLLTVPLTDLRDCRGAKLEASLCYSRRRPATWSSGPSAGAATAAEAVPSGFALSGDRYLLDADLPRLEVITPRELVTRLGL